VYTRSATDANAYASTLRSGFDEALEHFIEGLTSHRPLIEYAVSTGHRTRPVGCLLSCAAVGGRWSDALPLAVGIELIHKSSVIRDDIVDGDRVRSGQPALHAVHGVANAIAVSDVLWTLALQQIWNGAPPDLAEDGLLAAASALRDMAAGQLEDVSPSAARCSVDERLLVDEQKTGTLSELSCRLGAMVGGGNSGEIEALARYGRKIGTAFQVINDVRNLSGSEVARATASDVRNGRDTVLSAHMRQVATPEDLAAIELSLQQGTDVQVQLVRETLLASGAVDFGEALASRLLTEAGDALRVLQPTIASTILESLTHGVLRDYAF
jgi:geranylgeranyl diphosphate synthase, type I